ncbi:MAG: GNAT family N-acetyltransferase [Candidatus Poseidoniales archaeon]|jgi:N-acetylglutamate synthase-like GNAT family acetyltransferase|tara:strand:- start:817 stop:1227 length:411 start_codon:yes stop_codon:yes gene_type:complete
MFVLEYIVPSPKDYMDLRASAGMTPRSLNGAKKGLGNEIFSVIIKIKETDEIIGMGRIIGDGGTVFQICDMAVKPEWQNKGAGTMIMDSIMNYIEENAEENAYVNLLADVNGFYEKWGFKPTSPNSIGMNFRKINY